jgi:hypothetical protein
MGIKHVIELEDGDVFVTPKAHKGRPAHRRVLGVIGEDVRYSVGGDRNRTCRVTTFKKWLRTHNCIAPRHSKENWAL